MPCFSLRRTICCAAALTLLSSPAAPPGIACSAIAESASTQTPDALAPVESALQALRERAAEWLASLEFSFLPIGDDAPEDDDARTLIPGGQNIGVAMMCEGVLVIGTSDPGASESPARLAGIRSGDRITHVDGEAVVGADSFRDMLSDGDSVTLTVCRDDRTRTVELTPALDASDGAYRIGAWVRDSTAGVGTLTFIDPENDTFGALGHPIQDADTFATLPVAEGALYESRVADVRPGEAGVPGELVGSFMDTASEIGEILRNTACGIFGRYAADYDEDDALPIANRSEITSGPAQILTTVEGGDTQAYDIEIVKLYADGGTSSRSMMIRVTDSALLARTGGIVQGMSGSPIIQNGKLVGAVTHVLVNDPTMGYGIYIENMLDAAA